MSLRNCPVCGGAVPEGRNRRYCSDRCKDRAYYLRSLGTPPVQAEEPLANWPGTTIPMRVSVIEAFSERRNLTESGKPHGGES